MQFKFRPAFAAIILCSIITACGAGNVSSPNNILPTFENANSNSSAPSGGVCGNVLYPVTQGASWIYSSNGGPNGSFYYTNSITEVRADGFTLTTQFSDRTSTQEWLCQSEGLKATQHSYQRLRATSAVSESP